MKIHEMMVPEAPSIGMESKYAESLLGERGSGLRERREVIQETEEMNVAKNVIAGKSVGKYNSR